MLRSVFFILLGLVVSGSQAFADDRHRLEEDRLQMFRQHLLAGDFSLKLKASEFEICSAPCLKDYDIFIHAFSELIDDQKLAKESRQAWQEWLISQPLTEDERRHAAWTLRQEFPDEWRFLSAQASKGLGAKWQAITRPKIFSMEENRVKMARDLLQQPMTWSGVGLYMFCREDRRYPCLMVMRDATGAMVSSRGQVWSQPSLGYSRHQKNFDEVNGNTPSGVFHINGVMPFADKQSAYGKFRRLILDFLPKSKSEKNIRAVLPASSWNAQWWQEGVIARNIGRGLFRIHGTGQPAPVNEPYYPFFGTSGCVAQRENFYDGVEYKDQRLLLDRLMHSLGMHSVYENEESIQGLLFVMNINSEDRAVELSDLHRLKILPQ